MHKCVKRLCKKKKDGTGKPLLDRCKEACDTSCDDMPRCEGWYSWDPKFNNSCFGASNADAAKAKRNGVCEDGGPGAVHQYCAFGTSAPVIIIALTLTRFASSSPAQPRLNFGLTPAPAL